MKVAEAHAGFGRRLTSLRLRLGVSRGWLAREAGCTAMNLSYLERGRTCPTAETLGRLADALGYTMDELWRGVGRCEGVGNTREGGPS